jgi:predicted RNase H-like nuclease (RuvC/YqgF family)
MAEGKKAVAGKGVMGEGEGKADKSERRRLGYLKTRAQELKKELQANKEEAEALRKKLGKGGKRKMGKPGGDGDDE